MLKLKDLIEGEFYCSTINSFISNNENWIYKYKNINNNLTDHNYTLSHCKKFYNDNYHITDDNSVISIRLATQQEREHLQQCIDADKYVDYKPTKQELIFKMII